MKRGTVHKHVPLFLRREINELYDKHKNIVTNG